MVDYLQTQGKRVDMKKLALIGHSRLGKTALWAGVNEKRFKVIISNDSGCGGAALSKRVIGENIPKINR
ncbi:MAG: hypothetical protein Q4F97_08305 [Bacteroidales bacterium]|nr:hypothetical protein [Bacteroidales bacterium]